MIKEEEHKGFVVRLIRWEGVILANICDEELLGKTVKGENLEMHISKDYFGGERVGEDEALRLVKTSSIVNLVGNRIVKKVIEEKLAHELAVKKVGNVSFLMIFKFVR